jgi:hypothetical protein
MIALGSNWDSMWIELTSALLKLISTDINKIDTILVKRNVDMHSIKKASRISPTGLL